jgi:hypothetical protein
MKIKVSDRAIYGYIPTENPNVFNRKSVVFIKDRGYLFQENSVKIIKQILDGIVYEIEESTPYDAKTIMLENPRRYSKKRLGELFDIHVKGNTNEGN